MTGPGFGSVIAYLVVAGLLLSVSVSLALVVLLGVPVIAVLVGPLLGRLRGAEAVYREQQGGLTARIGDLSGGLRVLNGLGGKQLFADSFRRDSGELTGQGYRVGAVTSWVQALGVGLPMVFLALVTWLAARLAVEGSISVGEFVGVYGYVAVLVVPVGFFIECGYDVTRGLVAAKRVVGFLSLVPDSAVRQARTDPPAAPSALRDPGSGVEVAPGTLTALVSGRPAESAEVVDRLCGFAPGAVTWGPVRLDEVAAAQVRDRILVADNEADLFAGPLREMVSGRRHHDDEAVARAVRAAVAQDIVDGLPDGLGTAMDAQARNLSGGQRQRIRLVRALLAEPEVLMAVEPTSALDAHTEAAVAARLRTARTGRTTVVTGTSPVLLDQADTVHYLVDGKVVASGSHRDLLRREPGYRSLVDRSAAEADAPQVPAQHSPAEADGPGRTDQDPGGTATCRTSVAGTDAAGVADGGAGGSGTGERVGVDRTGGRGPGGDSRSPAREAADDRGPGAGAATGGEPPGDGPPAAAGRPGARGADGNRDGRNGQDEHGTGDAADAHRSGSGEVV